MRKCRSTFCIVLRIFWFISGKIIIITNFHRHYFLPSDRSNIQAQPTANRKQIIKHWKISLLLLKSANIESCVYWSIANRDQDGWKSFESRQGQENSAEVSILICESLFQTKTSSFNWKHFYYFFCSSFISFLVFYDSKEEKTCEMKIYVTNFRWTRSKINFSCVNIFYLITVCVH